MAEHDPDSDADSGPDADADAAGEQVDEPTDARPTLEPDAMRNFPVPEYEDLPSDLRERVDAEAERAGFVPNVFSAFASRPDQFRAFFDYYDALEEGALDRADLEMIVVAVSGRNHCYYCNVAHGALVRLYARDPHLADQLVANYRTADVSERRRVMLDVAVRLTEEPDAVTAADLDRLREAGFSEDELWDVGAVTAFFNLSNRMATFADMRPNDEFHALGRDVEE